MSASRHSLSPDLTPHQYHPGWNWYFSKLIRTLVLHGHNFNLLYLKWEISVRIFQWMSDLITAAQHARLSECARCDLDMISDNVRWPGESRLGRGEWGWLNRYEVRYSGIYTETESWQSILSRILQIALYKLKWSYPIEYYSLPIAFGISSPWCKCNRGHYIKKMRTECKHFVLKLDS